MLKVIITAALLIAVINEMTSVSNDVLNIAKQQVINTKQKQYSNLNTALAPLNVQLATNDEAINEAEKLKELTANLKDVVITEDTNIKVNEEFEVNIKI